jgi:hypothetical protein
MAKGTTKRNVAVLNSRQDLIEALQAGLEAEGFSTCGAHVADIKSGALDLLAFVHQHKPSSSSTTCLPPMKPLEFPAALKDTHSPGMTWVLVTTDKGARGRSRRVRCGRDYLRRALRGGDVVTAVSHSFPA